MHCLFAVLGESIHTHFTWSPWIRATLTSFIEFDKGTEEALEPFLISNMGLSSAHLLADILAHAGSTQNDSEREIDFCRAQPVMTINSAGINRLHATYNDQYPLLSKKMAHALFSSLCNPYGLQQEDIYLGAYKVIDENLNSIEQLIGEFKAKKSNVMIICCPINTKNVGKGDMHYVTVILTNSQELWYYDPVIGLEKPPPNSSPVQGYFVPTSLVLSKKLKKCIIFSGSRRCAFYFQVPLDRYGCMNEEAKKRVEWNLTERFKIIVQNYFGLTLPSDIDRDGLASYNLISLNDKTSDPFAVFQNRLVKVKPSNLRSLATGNPIGLGLYSKVTFENKGSECIGSWRHGKLTCLNAIETEAKNRE
jgi:hypothetical protein